MGRLGALWVGKALIPALRLFGRGASTLPGHVAGRMDPGLLAWLAGRTAGGNAIVTGTNGKTTTASLLAAMLTATGRSVTHNHTGANLVSGITTAYVAAADLAGHGRDFGLAEVDEATVPHAVKALAPRVAVVTNFFRDQLDRYGELDTAVTLVRKGLGAMPPGGVAVLNADDPLVAFLGEGLNLRVLFYGIDALEAVGRRPDTPSDAGHCRRCGCAIRFTRLYYAHLGHYVCDHCGFRRPNPQVVLAGIDRQGARRSLLRFETPAGPFSVKTSLGGMYNAYNALAATAAAQVLGVPNEVVRQVLASHGSAFGRMESIPIEGKEAFITLVKNPVGLSEVLRTVLDDGLTGQVLLIAINDRYADGRDVSWIWDADVELLAGRGGPPRAVVASGTRAEDMAVRLKYAGVPTDLVVIERDLGAALAAGLSRVPANGTLWVLPTYTALLELRELISRLGYARHWGA